ncbi:MAG TPA: cysteine--tRNA ligase [Aquirhabdus sp.]
MKIKIYNSLTRQIEEFKPTRESFVTIYSCGPTVYDHAHIGNLRTYIFEDTLRRVLKLNGYKLQHVMNITDVDDKTITRSQKLYPNDKPEVALKRLTQEFEKKFFEDTDILDIDFSETKIVRATEHIDDMQKLIQAIPNKYITADGVYFDIAKYPDYGIFIKLDRSHEHHRVNNDEYDKDHAADFVLWKARKEGEPAWDFEIDGKNIAGRPGWHIECAAMSVKYLGQPFDMHTGGVDLKFPHHENEIAQARAADKKPLANFFVHAEHLLVNGRKMSKSLGNFFTLSDIKKREIDPLAFRLLMLQSHYRSQSNFTWEAIAGAQTFLQNLRRLGDLVLQPKETGNGFNSKQLDDAKKAMLEGLGNDLNTARALGDLAQLTDLITALDKTSAGHIKNLLNFSDELLGLNLSAREDIGEEIKELIVQRNHEKDLQNYAKADALRHQLRSRNIGLNDTPHGTIWFRLDK